LHKQAALVFIFIAIFCLRRLLSFFLRRALFSGLLGAVFALVLFFFAGWACSFATLCFLFTALRFFFA
jgi:hypothetical protein